MFIWYIWKVFYPSHASMNNGRYVENGDDFYCSPVDELLVVIICDCDSFFLVVYLYLLKSKNYIDAILIFLL